jgi:hypothetical protein
MSIIKRTTIEDKKDCIGCNQYFEDNHDDSPCDFNPHYKKEDCPCLKCVVKMICLDPCQKYDDYHGKQIEDLYGKDKNITDTESMYPEDPSL